MDPAPPQLHLRPALSVSWICGALCLLDFSLGPPSLYASRLTVPAAAAIATNMLFVFPTAICALLVTAPLAGEEGAPSGAGSFAALGGAPSEEPQSPPAGSFASLGAPSGSFASLGAPSTPLLIAALRLLVLALCLLAPREIGRRLRLALRRVALVSLCPAWDAYCPRRDARVGAHAFLGPPLGVLLHTLGPLMLLHALAMPLGEIEFVLGAALLAFRKVLVDFSANRAAPPESPDTWH
jgi:hypothetical protein